MHRVCDLPVQREPSLKDHVVWFVFSWCEQNLWISLMQYHMAAQVELLLHPEALSQFCKVLPIFVGADICLAML